MTSKRLALLVLLLAFGATRESCARTPEPGSRLLAAIAPFDTAIMIVAQLGRSRWLVTSKMGARNEVRLFLVSNGRHPVILWRHVFEEGYEPAAYPSFRWLYRGQPTLLFTYQLGAAWQKLTVVGLGPHGPVILQQIDGGAFDVIGVTSEDGNGDLRSINGSLPLTHHCYDWVAERSSFAERRCKTLIDPAPADAP